MLFRSDETKYHVYEHPCSTCVLYYFIPDQFIDEIKNDKNFKIGFYGTDFNDYINKYYKKDHHMKGSAYIISHDIFKLNLPDWCEDKYNKHTLKNGMYYYEFDSADIKKLKDMFPELKEKLNNK